MYISVAKFEEHCSNTSRGIRYSVFSNFSCKPHDIPNLHNTETSIQYLLNEKRYSKENAAECLLLYFEMPFK